MSTFWERCCAIGDGAAEPIDLDAFEAAFVLYGTQKITWPEMVSWMGITEPQADEVNTFIVYAVCQPGDGDDLYRARARDMKFLFRACRSGRPSLDSVANVQTALGYTPPE